MKYFESAPGRGSPGRSGSSRVGRLLRHGQVGVGHLGVAHQPALVEQHVQLVDRLQAAARSPSPSGRSRLACPPASRCAGSARRRTRGRRRRTRACPPRARHPCGASRPDRPSRRCTSRSCARRPRVTVWRTAAAGGYAPGRALRCTVRVALVSPYSYTYPGGVGRHVEALAEELLRQGHEVRLLTPYDPDDRLARVTHRGVSPQSSGPCPITRSRSAAPFGLPMNGAVSNLVGLHRRARR